MQKPKEIQFLLKRGRIPFLFFPFFSSVGFFNIFHCVFTSFSLSSRLFALSSFLSLIPLLHSILPHNAHARTRDPNRAQGLDAKLPNSTNQRRDGKFSYSEMICWKEKNIIIIIRISFHLFSAKPPGPNFFSFSVYFPCFFLLSLDILFSRFVRLQTIDYIDSHVPTFSYPFLPPGFLFLSPPVPFCPNLTPTSTISYRNKRK